jgi:hypothetical protein
MPDKLRALELDAKLAGELVGGVPSALEDAAPAQTEEETQARLAHVLGLLAQHSGKRLVRPEGAEIIEQREEIARDSSVDRLNQISLALARQMARTGVLPRL